MPTERTSAKRSLCTPTTRTSDEKHVFTKLYRGETRIPFVQQRKRWYLVSALIMLVCIGSLVFRGFNAGVAFAGGTTFQIRAQGTSITTDEVNRAFTDAGQDSWLPSGHYRNQFWVPGGGHTLLCLGIHGQLIWVDRERDLVIVKHSSWPTPQDLHRLTSTFAAIKSIGDELERTTAWPGRRSWFSLLR